MTSTRSRSARDNQRSPGDVTTPIIVLTGPTAVGKTDLSLHVAETVDAEIISADSRQIYRGLDVGTAKPSQRELARVRHHFVDELDLGEPYSAGAFYQQACARIAEIYGRGKTPLVVGGSTLYIHALKHGLADIPNVPPRVRRSLERRLEHEGGEALYAELRAVDPRSAATMDETKSQRLVRALEVYVATGRPLSSYYRTQESPSHAFTTFVLHRDRAALYDRINRRVDAMLERGLLDEVRSILAAGYDPTLNPLQTIGYQEPIAFLNGHIAIGEMVRLIKRNSRRYAKRQLTWFRRDEENVWIDAARPVDSLMEDVLRLS